MTPSAYEPLCQHFREIALLQSTIEALGWDERTKMPIEAGAYRAEQIAHLSSLVHRRQTDPHVGQWLAELEESPLAADPHSDSGATIRQLRREYDKAVKLPPRLVEELSRAAVLGQQTWTAARANNDFASFQPALERIVELTREKAAAYGHDACPYDALLDDYEPAATTEAVAGVLEALRGELVPLVAEIGASRRRPRGDVLKREFPVPGQEAFGKQTATEIGFDFRRGRLDVTAHPFCAGLGPDDCRITTRYDERFFSSAFFGILHEAGHGIYEQGLRGEFYGLPPGSYVSLGIHESQSRMWENLVGRSRAFWEHCFPRAQEVFPTALGDLTLDEFHFAVNEVRPSLIRVEADEATYNLHIIVRFELEKALINDEFEVAELPAAWREKYRQYLNVEPPTDTEGVLQDVHWSAALIGYFPTYALGNLYAAQFFEVADVELGGLHAQFARGEFGNLRSWLQEKIHLPGQCYSAEQLVEKVTGKPLSHRALLNCLREKLAPLYGLA
jgi:carboxypeptidase Taq